MKNIFQLNLKYLFVLKVLTVFYKRSGNNNSKQFQLDTRYPQSIYIKQKMKKLSWTMFPFVRPEDFLILISCQMLWEIYVATIYLKLKRSFKISDECISILFRAYYIK